MKKVVVYLTTVILSIFAGGILMYGIIYFFPNTIVKTTTMEQKVVNVIDDGIAEGISNVFHAVVIVESYKNNSAVSTGSGFAFKELDGYTYIMTNHHVINNAKEIVVILEDETEISGILVGSDAYCDIAVLKIKSNNKLSIATMGKTNDMKVGDTVFAVGSPLGKTFSNTVTRGILSGKNRLVETTISGTKEEWLMSVIQTDAAINPGNSGGPLCDASGKVIGINSLKIVESSVEGLGFAISIEDAINYATSIIETGKIIRGYIGIQMLNVNEKTQLSRNDITIDSNIKEGVVIVEVQNNSPAKDANLKSGDVIIKINNDKVSNISEFRYHLYKYKIGDEVTLSIHTDGKQENVKIKIKASE